MPETIEEDEYPRKLANQSQMLRYRKKVKIISHTPISAYPNSFPHKNLTGCTHWWHLFPQNTSNFPKPGILKYFPKNWAKLTNEPTTLETVQGCNILFIVQPEQLKDPRKAIIS